MNTVQETQMTDITKNVDETISNDSYSWRRDHLLEIIRRTNWEFDEPVNKKTTNKKVRRSRKNGK